MPTIERTAKQLVLKSGATTLTLDKDAGTARLQRKFMFFNLKPMQASLSDVVSFDVDAGVDRASGIDVCNVMLITRDGAAWAVPALDKKEAATTAATLKEFVGLRN
jgi:hypothetical protein